MATTENQPSLVILGSWNPAILTPKWLSTKIFDKPDDVEMLVTMEFATTPGMPPKYSIEGISFVPANNKLMINPKDDKDDSLKSVEDKAIKLLSILSHTPISAFGQNFEFIEPDPSDELLRDFIVINGNFSELLDEGQELITSRIITSHETGGGMLHFTRVFSKGQMSLKFNFHYDVSSADDASAKMNGTFIDNFTYVKELLCKFNTTLTVPDEV